MFDDLDWPLTASPGFVSINYQLSFLFYECQNTINWLSDLNICLDGHLFYILCVRNEYAS